MEENVAKNDGNGMDINSVTKSSKKNNLTFPQYVTELATENGDEQVHSLSTSMKTLQGKGQGIQPEEQPNLSNMDWLSNFESHDNSDDLLADISDLERSSEKTDLASSANEDVEEYDRINENESDEAFQPFMKQPTVEKLPVSHDTYSDDGLSWFTIT